jgi:hypothetical protein
MVSFVDDLDDRVAEQADGVSNPQSARRTIMA